MDTLIYDHTFEGFLSAVFHVYEYKLKEVKICRSAAVLFDTVTHVDTDVIKAERVWTGLSKKLSAAGLQSLYCSYLADTICEEDNMLAYIRYALSSSRNIETDYSDFAVMRLQRVERMVHRESHRMKAFIRFQLTKDEIYYAAIEPDFNVLPLVQKHFEKRYADQKWLIYDLRRSYGIYYDLDTTQIVQITFDDKSTGDIALYMDDKEELYQTLWQQYYKSTNIPGRKNMKLHIQHTPKRYWKYLSEKHVMGKTIL
jgi:probable DNA metabolism protein